MFKQNCIQIFLIISGITRYHHFTFDDDRVICQEFINSEKISFHLRLSDPTEMPDIIIPPGLSIERQWYLFDYIRTLCADISKADFVAPKPTQEKTKTRGKKCEEKSTPQKKAKLTKGKNKK